METPLTPIIPTITRTIESQRPHQSRDETIVQANAQSAPSPEPQKRGSFKSLSHGFALLRLVQLINFDIYYLGGSSHQPIVSPNESSVPTTTTTIQDGPKLRARWDRVFQFLGSNIKIFLSFLAIVTSLIKTISSIILCLMSRDMISMDQPDQELDSVYFDDDHRHHHQFHQMGNQSISSNFQLINQTTFELRKNLVPNITMGWFVLILTNISSTIIIYSTVLNGHLLWNSLNQSLFLVGRKFQYKSMLSFLIFILLEYSLNSLFVNNLYAWPFKEAPFAGRPSLQQLEVSADDSRPRENLSSYHYVTRPRDPTVTTKTRGYSFIMAQLEVLVTDRSEHNRFLSLILGLFQFARGIIRISPYITLNYCMLCLKKHMEIIRNQNLLTESIKRRQRLRLVATSTSSRRIRLMEDVTRRRRTFSPLRKLSNLASGGGNTSNSSIGASSNNSPGGRGKKRVIFAPSATEPTTFLEANNNNNNNNHNHISNRRPSLGGQTGSVIDAVIRQTLDLPSETITPPLVLSRQGQSPSLVSLGARSLSSLSESRISQFLTVGDSLGCCDRSSSVCCALHQHRIFDEEEGEGDGCGGGGGDSMGTDQRDKKVKTQDRKYLDCVRDFNELESNITKLYIFTGRLNRLMSRLGLLMFFIAHNLLISCSLIVPQAISFSMGASTSDLAEQQESGPEEDSYQVGLIYVVRFVVVLIGILPFLFGQTLNSQLEQLSKQIDRIIIWQRINSSRRDHLVRTRELLHDIRLNCAGLVFNIENGIFKYLLVAFASAFFVEQRDINRKRLCQKLVLIFERRCSDLDLISLLTPELKMEWWTGGMVSTEQANNQIMGLDVASSGLNSGSIFDPWLTTTCDELDLGIILNQTTSTSNSSDGSLDCALKQQPAQAQQPQIKQSQQVAATATEGQQAGRQQLHSAPTHNQRSSINCNNRRNLINILGCSMGSSRQNNNHSNNNHSSSSSNNGSSSSSSSSSSSTAASPISSSEPSPASSCGARFTSPVQQLNNYTAQQHFESYQSNSNNDYINNNNNNDNNNSNNNDPYSVSCCLETNGQQQQQFYNQQQSAPALVLVSPTDSIKSSSNSGALVASTHAGSSLLSSISIKTELDNGHLGRRQPQLQPTRGQRPGNQQRVTSATVTATATATTGSSASAPKVRRCRHITDFVLAEEEKRLLIKEGYTDFPMSCQTRPLSKVEERILRKIRRKIRNKKSAQCSRQRKKEYVEDLEKKYAFVVKENEELKRIVARLQASRCEAASSQQSISGPNDDKRQSSTQDLDNQFRQHNHIFQSTPGGHTNHSILRLGHSSNNDNSNNSNNQHQRQQQHHLASSASTAQGSDQVDWKDFFPHSSGSNNTNTNNNNNCNSLVQSSDNGMY